MTLFSIGEFSRASGLTVKTLRFYHEKQLLVPAHVERETGYRNYDKSNLERANVIVSLRALGFSLDAISAILSDCREDGDVLSFLEERKLTLQSEIRERDDIVQVLDTIIESQQDARNVMTNVNYEVEEKTLSPVMVGGIRTKGRYSDCGKLFGQLGRKLGRHIGGKAMMLYYDDEYREEDADFEACMPLKRRVEADGVDVRELPGGRCISLIHEGPYEELRRSYCRIIEHAKEHKLQIANPSREVYLKGPGLIFKGNPKKYLTEIQFLIEP